MEISIIKNAKFLFCLKAIKLGRIITISSSETISQSSVCDREKMKKQNKSARNSVNFSSHSGFSYRILILSVENLMNYNS